MLLHIYWTVVLIFSILFLIYFNIFLLTFDTNFPKNTFYNGKNGTNYDNGKQGKTEVSSVVSEAKTKHLVGYSLLKQIELDGQEIFCGYRRKGVENSTGKVEIGNKRDTKNNSVQNVHDTSQGKQIKQKPKEIWTKVEESNVYIHSVNFDSRLEPYYYIRVVAAIKDSSNDTIYCQIYDSDNSTGTFRTIKATVVPIWYRKWNQNDNHGYFNPVLISCRLPVKNIKKSESTIQVGLSKNHCEPSQNVFTVEKQTSPPPVQFTVCVKPLNFENDITKHLIQWFEINKVLGAQKFYIFVGNVSSNTERILKWYSKNHPEHFQTEQFNPIQTSNGSNVIQGIWQRRKYEIIAYNSCFYKNLNSKYVISLDIDELIVPKTGESWFELLKNVSKFEKYTSLLVQNVYFFESYIPTTVFFDNDQRTKISPKNGDNVKSFVSTKNALTIFNHYSLHSLPTTTPLKYFLPISTVQLNHYKKSCDSIVLEKCAQYISSPKILDDSIFRFRDKFFANYKFILKRVKKDEIRSRRSV